MAWLATAVAGCVGLPFLARQEQLRAWTVIMTAVSAALLAAYFALPVAIKRLSPDPKLPIAEIASRFRQARGIAMAGVALCTPAVWLIVIALVSAALDQHPAKAALVLILPALTVWLVFSRIHARECEPLDRLSITATKEEQPGVWAECTSIARRHSFPPPGRIELVPGGDCSVHREGKEAILWASVPLARILTVPEFRAVLAHELANLAPSGWLAFAVAREYLCIEVAQDLVLRWGVRSFPAPAILEWMLRTFSSAIRSVQWRGEFEADIAAVRESGTAIAATGIGQSRSLSVVARRQPGSGLGDRTALRACGGSWGSLDGNSRTG